MTKVSSKNDKTNNSHVFVYGSLKLGLGNSGLLKSVNAEFVGYDTISGPMTMISCGGFPAVCHNSAVKGVNEIFGQVFKLNQEGLRTLDGLEGHPRWYCREKMITDYLDKRAWIYLMPESSLTASIVADNMWRVSKEETAYWEESPFNYKFAA